MGENEVRRRRSTSPGFHAASLVRRADDGPPLGTSPGTSGPVVTDDRQKEAADPLLASFARPPWRRPAPLVVACLTSLLLGAVVVRGVVSGGINEERGDAGALHDGDGPAPRSTAHGNPGAIPKRGTGKSTKSAGEPVAVKHPAPQAPSATQAPAPKPKPKHARGRRANQRTPHRGATARADKQDLRQRAARLAGLPPIVTPPSMVQPADQRGKGSATTGTQADKPPATVTPAGRSAGMNIPVGQQPGPGQAGGTGESDAAYIHRITARRARAELAEQDD